MNRSSSNRRRQPTPRRRPNNYARTQPRPATRRCAAQAELENFRKRMHRDMEEDRRYAEQALLTDLLPVLDNIGRAIKAAESTADVNSLLAGVKMVAQQLDGLLAKHHCQRIAADGSEFDPHLHQAISMQPRDDLPPNSVVLVAQEGYQLHDRVLRPSQVIVSTASPAAAETG